MRRRRRRQARKDDKLAIRQRSKRLLNDIKDVKERAACKRFVDAYVYGIGRVATAANIVNNRKLSGDERESSWFCRLRRSSFYIGILSNLTQTTYLSFSLLSLPPPPSLPSSLVVANLICIVLAVCFSSSYGGMNSVHESNAYLHFSNRRRNDSFSWIREVERRARKHNLRVFRTSFDDSPWARWRHVENQLTNEDTRRTLRNVLRVALRKKWEDRSRNATSSTELLSIAATVIVPKNHLVVVRGDSKAARV